MTSRQRILAAIRLETPDRVPVMPFGLGKLDPNGVVAADLIRTTEPVLVCRTGADPVLGSAARVETAVEPEGDGDITITRYHTPKGLLTQRVQRTAVTSATIDFPLKSADDVEKFLSIPYEAPKPDLSAFRKRKQDTGEEALVMMGSTTPFACCGLTRPTCSGNSHRWRRTG